jgi:hypothetical protein
MSITLENFLDKQLLLVLRDTKSLVYTGLEHDHQIVTLRGYEERHGIWVEIESIKDCPVKSDGNPLTDCPAILFIPWYHINTILHFPGKEKLELNPRETRKAGFRRE